MWRRIYLRCLRYLGPSLCMVMVEVVMGMKVVVVKMVVDRWW